MEKAVEKSVENTIQKVEQGDADSVSLALLCRAWRYGSVSGGELTRQLVGLGSPTAQLSHIPGLGVGGAQPAAVAEDDGARSGRVGPVTTTPSRHTELSQPVLRACCVHGTRWTEASGRGGAAAKRLPFEDATRG